MLFWDGFAKFEPNSEKRNFSTSVLNGSHDLHDTSTFGYYGNQIIIVAEREYSNTASNHHFFFIKKPHCTIQMNDKEIKVFGKASLLNLDK